MPLNPNIILEATRDMPNLGATYVNALDAGRKAGAQNAAIERANKFASLQANIPKGVSRTQYLSSQGFPEEALALDKTEAEVGKLKAEGGIKDVERQEKVKALAGKVYQFVLSHPRPTKDVVAQVFQDAANNGDMPLEMYHQVKAGLANMPDDPEEIRALAKARVMELTSPKDQMQFVQPDANAQLGAQTQMRGQDITQQNNLANQDLNRQEFGFNQNKFSKEFGLNQEQEQFRQANEMAKFGLDKKKHLDTKGTANKSNQSAIDSIDTAIESLNTIIGHKGREAATGVLSVVPSFPGGDAAGFDARLETFKAQTFVPMVAQLKGMGALSDAEGKKLTAAVGALDPKMSDEEFLSSAKDILGELELKKRRAMGDMTPRQSGASGSWDDAAINAEAQKRGKSPEAIRAYLKARGMMQ